MHPPGPIDPGPIRPQAEAYPEGYAGAPLSEEDVAALEDLIVESEGDLDL